MTNGLPPLARLALVVDRFRDLDGDATVAAVATDDGGAVHLKYGDLRALLNEAATASTRLGRITDWHSREVGPAGSVGNLCDECGQLWPCVTRQMSDETLAPDANPD